MATVIREIFRGSYTFLDNEGVKTIALPSAILNDKPLLTYSVSGQEYDAGRSMVTAKISGADNESLTLERMSGLFGSNPTVEWQIVVFSSGISQFIQVETAIAANYNTYTTIPAVNLDKSVVYCNARNISPSTNLTAHHWIMTNFSSTTQLDHSQSLIGNTDIRVVCQVVEFEDAEVKRHTGTSTASGFNNIDFIGYATPAPADHCLLLVSSRLHFGLSSFGTRDMRQYTTLPLLTESIRVQHTTEDPALNTNLVTTHLQMIVASFMTTERFTISGGGVDNFTTAYTAALADSIVTLSSQYGSWSAGDSFEKKFGRFTWRAYLESGTLQRYRRINTDEDFIIAGMVTTFEDDAPVIDNFNHLHYVGRGVFVGVGVGIC